MKKLFAIAVLALSVILTGCGTVETGQVGVRTSMTGKVDLAEEQQGFYTAVLSNVDIYTFKETSVELDNVTTPAGDNLNVSFDMAIFYEVNKDAVAEFHSTRAGQSSCFRGEGFCRLGYGKIRNEALGVATDLASKITSLKFHQSREKFAADMIVALQKRLDAADPGTFKVARVVVSDVQTDDSIQDAIRKSIQAQKDVETAKERVNIVKEQAEANAKLSASLTPAILQHEYNEALSKCAGNSNCTLIVGLDNATPLLSPRR